MGTDPLLIDALGRRVPLDPAPRRIVSLVPSVTECLFDLGAGDRVVGRTDFCISPAERVAGISSIGGPKTVDLERVTRLRPDLVFANAEENERTQVETLIANGFRVHVAFPRTIEDAAQFLEHAGALVGETDRAVRMAADLRDAAGFEGPTVPVACLIWKDPYMTVNRDTLTSAILQAAGAENVFAALTPRYPAVSQEDLAAARPRVILLPTEPYPFGEREALELRAAIPGAVPEPVQGEWVTWYGSRMPEAIEGLRKLLTPHRARAGERAC